MGQIYGINPVMEALLGMSEAVETVFLADEGPGRGANRRLAEIAELCRQKGVRVVRSDRRTLSEMAAGGVHQGAAAKIRAPEYADFDALVDKARAAGPNGLVMLLDGIEDPHNLGALCRSASALGAQGIVIGKDRAAGITPAAIKASAGALPMFPVSRVTNLGRALEALKEAGFWSVAADMKGDRAPEDVDMASPTVLIVGSEGKGIRKGLIDKCDFLVRIPMTGHLSSLNASVAGAILLAEAARQRRGKKR